MIIVTNYCKVMHPKARKKVLTDGGVVDIGGTEAGGIMPNG